MGRIGAEPEGTKSVQMFSCLLRIWYQVCAPGVYASKVYDDAFRNDRRNLLGELRLIYSPELNHQWPYSTTSGLSTQTSPAGLSRHQ